jgi:predicted transcriptional regulator
MLSNIVNLSGIVKSPLVDEAGDRIGRIEDVVVRLGDYPHPPVVGYVVRIGTRDLFVPAEKIGSLEDRPLVFQGKRLDLRQFERREGEILLSKDLLARHLINFVGGRLIRANDVLLAKVDGIYEVVAVDPGRRPLMQRLVRGRLSEGVSRSGVIDFASIIPFVSHVPSAKLRIPYRKLSRLHPAQIADLVEAASHDEGEEIIEAVGEDLELEADVFEELDMEHQIEFLESRTDPEAARILARMAPDDAADLITEIEQERRLPILDLLPEPQQQKVRNLLSYNPETAGGIMSPDYVSVRQDATVAVALDAIKASTAPTETLNVVFVVNEHDALIGAAPIARLVRASLDEPVVEVSKSESAHVHANWDLNRVARQMSDFNLTVVPVVDDEHNRMLGVVTIDDLIELLLPQGWRREFGMATNEE